MSDPREQLKTMLQNFINDKQEDAAAALHDYLVYKTQQVAGLAPAEEIEDSVN